MQINISFPDSGFSDVIFTACETSIAGDALRVAASEWGVDISFLQLTCEANLIPEKSKLVSLGFQDGTQLVAVMQRPNVVTREQLLNQETRSRVDSYFEANPEVMCIIDAKEMTSAGGCFETEEDLLPDCVKHVSFCNCDNVTSLGNNFLCGYKKLETIDFSPLENIEFVGTYFLYNCWELASIDLSFMIKTCTISSYFLVSCYSLTSLDLTPLRHVTAIGDYFLSNCKEIKTIDLSLLSNVRSTGYYFLCNCPHINSDSFCLCK